MNPYLPCNTCRCPKQALGIDGDEPNLEEVKAAVLGCG